MVGLEGLFLSPRPEIKFTPVPCRKRAKSSLDGHSGGDEPSSTLKAAALDPDWGCPAVFIVLPKNRSNALVSSQDVFLRRPQRWMIRA